jgi:hypothetical protein
MEQLQLQIAGFSLKPLIDHFSQHKMYRWYPEEIAAEIRTVAHDEAVISHFTKQKRYLWYCDEIVTELKSLTKVPF